MAMDLPANNVSPVRIFCRTFTFVFSLTVCPISIADQQSPQTSANDTAPNSQVSSQSAIEQAEYYLYFDPQKTITLTNELVEDASQKKDDLTLAVALRLLGQAQMFQGNNQLAYANLKEALEVAIRTNDPHLLSVSNRALGVFYELILDYSKALDYYLKGLGFAEQSSNADDKATIYNNIGNVFNAQGAYEDAIRYFTLAIELYAQQNNFEMLMNAKVGLGVSQLKAGELTKAESTLKEVVAEKDDTSGFTYSEAMVNLAHLEKSRNNFQEAITLYHFVLDDEKGRSYPPAVAAAYLGLGESLVATGQTGQARSTYQQGLNEVGEKTSVESEMALFEQLASLELAEQEYQAAAQVQARYIERRNQVQPLTQQGLVSKLETQLTMERELIRLQNELLVRERESRNNTLYLLGVILLAMTSLTLFLLLRLRKQALTRLESSNTLLKKASETDPLTSIGNRRYLQNKLNQKQGQDESLAFLLLDIDHFKAINDVYGHKSGDHLLKDLSERMKQLCRKNEVLARIGGEEFVLLLFGISKKSAIQFAERIRKNIAQMPTICDEPVTVSIGVSYGNVKRSDYDELYKQADTALYEAKNTGRNKVEVYSN